MNGHPSLRITPANSPFHRSVAPRSPLKSDRPEEFGLCLKRVIGSTTTSANAFDSCPVTRSFAYAAGAASVVATIGADGLLTQRFFKAKPTALAVPRETHGAPGPSSSAPLDVRGRALDSIRQHAKTTSPLSAGRNWPDSPLGRTTTAKDRIKAVTAIALSPDGRWLAIGETGYRPRVLLFSLAEGASEAPVVSISEHTFGVHALRFSADSKYLASLGTPNDGFLYIWQVDERTGHASLYASNKCTVLVNSLTWAGHAVITVGLRFVKVWQLASEPTAVVQIKEDAAGPSTPRSKREQGNPDFGHAILSSGNKVLSGKNSLLGDLLECNFVAVLPVSESEAIICASSGEVCKLSDIQRAQTLSLITTVPTEIVCACLLGDDSIALCSPGQPIESRLDLPQQPSKSTGNSSRRKTLRRSLTRHPEGSDTIAVARLSDLYVALSHDGAITIRSDGENLDNEKNRHLAGHASPICAVESVHSTVFPEATLLTCSLDGRTCLWSAHGALVESITLAVEHYNDAFGVENQVASAALCRAGSVLAFGDRYGTVAVQDLNGNKELSRVRAHSSEVTVLLTFQHQGLQLLASGSRDRTIQIFGWQDDKLELYQTLDEHAGAVNGLMTAGDGARFLSCSADRSVVVREAFLRKPNNPASLAYVIERTIALKSAPTSLCLGPKDSIFVAASDRSITRYDLETGQAFQSFKCSDNDGGEAVVLSSLAFSATLYNTPSIIGVSSTDKSIRVYSETGLLLARDWGHTEGLSGLAVITSTATADEDNRESDSIVTVAADSTVFIWRPIARYATGRKDSADALAPLLQVNTAPPLRKVISHSELSVFRRQSLTEDGDPSSSAVYTAKQPGSPHRLRKKTSRLTIAQPPRLEPAFRSSFAESSRRASVRQRSPSPPSPRNIAKKERLSSRSSLGMSLRSKSSENILQTLTAASGPSSGYGSLTASTESVCRTLRAYRKKLASAQPAEVVPPETLRELDKELKLTVRALNDKSQGKTLDETVMARLLDQASEKIVDMLDERIKGRAASEARLESDASPLSPSFPAPTTEKSDTASSNT